jgi:hypothetical protein
MRHPVSDKRGNKTSVHTRTKRAERVIELAQAGATKQEIATDIGVSRVTLWRYLQALDVQFVESNHDAITALKKKVAGEIAEQADNVLTGQLDPKAAHAWNGLMSTFNKLLGLNAPAKSVTAHVEVNPEHSQEFLDYRAAVAHLNDEQRQDVLRYARSLPNLWTPDMLGPLPQLTEGDNDAS